MDSARAGEGFFREILGSAPGRVRKWTLSAKEGSKLQVFRDSPTVLKRSAKMAKFAQKRSVLQKGCQFANNLARKCQPLPFRATKNRHFTASRSKDSAKWPKMTNFRPKKGSVLR